MQFPDLLLHLVEKSPKLFLEDAGLCLRPDQDVTVFTMLLSKMLACVVVPTGMSLSSCCCKLHTLNVRLRDYMSLIIGCLTYTTFLAHATRMCLKYLVPGVKKNPARRTKKQTNT